MSTYNKILQLTDTLIQQCGFLGFSYADLEKGIGIRKASIHHHFPGKNDLGLAYCEYKIREFNQLDTALRNIAPGVQRLKAYFNAFSGCAERKEMCGVYAMLSDSNQFSPELQKAVNLLVQTEMVILKDILVSGLESRELKSIAHPDELVIIVCSALKGALMLNRMSPQDAYARTIDGLMLMLGARS